MTTDKKYPPPPKEYRNPEDDPTYITGLFPTCVELAEQLARNHNEHLVSVKLPQER
jgi:hypothetical protein